MNYYITLSEVKKLYEQAHKVTLGVEDTLTITSDVIVSSDEKRYNEGHWIRVGNSLPEFVKPTDFVECTNYSNTKYKRFVHDLSLRDICDYVAEIRNLNSKK